VRSPPQVVECATVLASSLASGIALEPLFHKPGCVSRLRDFEDKKLPDFVLCGLLAVAPLTMAVLDGLKREARIGLRVRQIVELCMGIVGRNVCLGTAILLTPLATAVGMALARSAALEPRTLTSLAREAVLECGVEESIELYRAIRLASPSYVRPSDETRAPNVWDPHFEESLRNGFWTLAKVLEDAAQRDLVSREIIEGYPRTLRVLERLSLDEESVLHSFIELLSSDLDTVVARKGGVLLAEVCRSLARAVAEKRIGVEVLDKLMIFNRVSPGSTADIVATAISLHVLGRVAELLQERIKLCIVEK